MLLYLVRHAQSEANAGVRGAAVDCQLTDLGRRQAAEAGRRLAELGIDRVLASPYTRALETADAIRRATGVSAGIVPLLHEHHVRPFTSEDWPLLSRAALTERYPAFEPPADFDFAAKWHDVPETEEAVLDRGARVLDELWRRYAAVPDGSQDVRLALVSHGSPTGKLVMAALRVPSPQGVEVNISNASITIVEYFPNWRALRACNLTDHLPSS